MGIKKTDSYDLVRDDSVSDFTPYCGNVSDIELALNFIPIGSIFPFIPKDITSTIVDINTIISPFNFAVCDGSALNDPDSPIFNGPGRYLPNITDDRFLMGGVTLPAKIPGTIGGQNTLPNHNHLHTLVAPAIYHASTVVHSHGHATSTIDVGNGHAHSHYYWVGADGGDGQMLLNYYQRGDSPTFGHKLFHAAIFGFQMISNDESYQAYNSTTFPAAKKQRHTHTWTFVNSSASYNIAHSHNMSFSGTVGSGSSPTSTSSLPKFMACYFIMKYKDFSF